MKLNDQRITCAFGFAFALMLALAFAVACGDDDSGTCAAGQTDCFGVCVDTATDRLNCGTCGNACGGPEICNSGLCVMPTQVQVFVTSLEVLGNMGGAAGLATADAFCTTAATNAGLAGTWTAWLSDGTTNAVTRIFNGGTTYRLLNGTVIADNLADLLDGTLDSPIIVREDGTPIPGGALEVWTGTDTDGTNSGVGTCTDWTDNSAGSTGQVGRADLTDAGWTDNTGLGEELCDVNNKLYCFADATVPFP